jgi:hypothetical protein
MPWRAGCCTFELRNSEIYSRAAPKAPNKDRNGELSAEGIAAELMFG